VALGIQHAKNMCHIMLSSMTCLSVTYFSTSSHKGEKKFEKLSYWAQNACFDFLYSCYLKHFSI